MAATEPSIARPTDTVVLADLWRAMLDCPSEALYWASLGWRIGLLEGTAEVHREIGRAGLDMVATREWRETIKRPTFAELQRRRGVA